MLSYTRFKGKDEFKGKWIYAPVQKLPSDSPLYAHEANSLEATPKIYILPKKSKKAEHLINSKAPFKGRKALDEDESFVWDLAFTGKILLAFSFIVTAASIAYIHDLMAYFIGAIIGAGIGSLSLGTGILSSFSASHYLGKFGLGMKNDITAQEVQDVLDKEEDATVLTIEQESQLMRDQVSSMDNDATFILLSTDKVIKSTAVASSIMTYEKVLSAYKEAVGAHFNGSTPTENESTTA